MGYHLAGISQGKIGELSKIREELEEAIDAENQKNMVMVLLELSDIIGAIECYMENKFGKILSIEDLINMSKATKRAFLSGERTCKQ